MTYQPLGHRAQTGVPDTTGANPGKWTVTFDPALINVNVPYFEVYKIVVTGAKGSSFVTFVDTAQWDAPQRGDTNTWDPQQGVPLTPGAYLYFYWSDQATDGFTPQVTIWLRFDQAILGNQAYLQQIGSR